MLNRLRSFIRGYFTRTVLLAEAKTADTTSSNVKVRSRRRHTQVPPSERFVWAMVVLIVALVGLVAIEVAYTLVTGQISTEILVVISGLVGALASRFLEGKKN